MEILGTRRQGHSEREIRGIVELWIVGRGSRRGMDCFIVSK